MIQLGNDGQWVNPKYVTSVTRAEFNSMPDIRSRIWVVGNAGYGTYEILSNLTPREVAEKINKRVKTPTRNEDILKNH